MPAKESGELYPPLALFQPKCSKWNLTVPKYYVNMSDIAEKAKGVLLACGFTMLVAWPFVALALTINAGQ